MNKENYTMLCDFYELTMSNGYFESNMADQICYFDVFYRSVPDNGGFAIACGLETIIEYINNLHFADDDIKFLKNKGIFSEKFLNYLKTFKFSGDIYAVKEGSVIFPNEPIIIVKAKAIEAQMIETYLLLTLNHQSLVATKTNRIVRAANGRAVMEFGSRRAQGASAAILGARSAYIAGACGTACTITDKEYGVPALGTMAHSWVQMFDSEYEAFKTYCEIYPNNATLLVDTYNVLNSGIPNAIKVFKEVLWPKGIKKCGIRIDSGDITYLSRKARKMLDEAGLQECKICVSNSLDEKLIEDLIYQGACIDTLGVGERLITSKSDPVFGCVYKLSAIENKEGIIIPKIKVSENSAKITNPGFKKVVRIYDNVTHKALADLICLADEEINVNEDLEIFDPEATWKRKKITNYHIKELLVPIFKDGNLVYDLPPLKDIREYCLQEVSSLWDEIKRMVNPHMYYVDLSQKLWDLKQSMLNKIYK